MILFWILVMEATLFIIRTDCGRQYKLWLIWLGFNKDLTGILINKCLSRDKDSNLAWAIKRSSRWHQSAKYVMLFIHPKK